MSIGRSMRWVGVGLALAGCSADAAPEPEPKVDTPGAFVAREAQPGNYELFHTLVALNPDNQGKWLFLMQYGSGLPDLAEARRLAQSLPIESVGFLATASEREFLAMPVSVVWFRTLSEAERNVLR